MRQEGFSGCDTLLLASGSFVYRLGFLKSRT
jgi:hypothetical protein